MPSLLPGVERNLTAAGVSGFPRLYVLSVAGARVYTVHGEWGREVEYEWDPKKAERNLRKHGVEFVDVPIVFDDDRAITLLDEHPGAERYLTFGMDAQRRILAISYAVRGSTIRIISARKATSRERAQYEDKRI